MFCATSCETKSNEINLNNVEGSPFYVAGLSARYQTLSGPPKIFRILVEGEATLLRPIAEREYTSHRARCLVGDEWQDVGVGQGTDPTEGVPKDGTVGMIAVSPNLPDDQPNAVCEFDWTFEDREADASVSLGIVCLQGTTLAVGGCDGAPPREE